MLVDANSQGNLTTCMSTLANLMHNSIMNYDINTKDVILHYKENLDLNPSNLDLSTMEMSLVNVMSREYTLKI